MVTDLEDAQAPGLYLALEGQDGAGKSSIRNLIHDALVALGNPCIIVGQHSWLDIDIARRIINAREARFSYPPEELIDGYFRDKQLHIDRTVVPALAHASVIADRSFISDAVYQEVLYGTTAERTLERYRSAGTRMPDLVLWIDSDSDQSYERIVKRGGQHRHYERPAPLRQISSVYRRVLFQNPAPWSPEIQIYRNETRPDWQQVVRRDLVPGIVDRLRLMKSARPIGSMPRTA